MQIDDKRKAKLNYKLHVILMLKGILVFVFANYLDNVQVWNYAMIGFKRVIEKAGIGFHFCQYLCLKLPEIQAFA